MRVTRRSIFYYDAFTLIELLVVLSIIGLLASIVTTQLNEGRSRAQYARAQSDLYNISVAIAQLESDTGETIAHNIVGQCGEDDNEGAGGPTGPSYGDGGEHPIYGSHPGYGASDFTNFSGLSGTDGNYANWNGPYIAAGVMDPWGRSYWYDPDYQCRPAGGGGTTKGCENASQAGPAYRVIYSKGPSATAGSNDYGSDNVVRILCRNTCQFSDENDDTPIAGTCID